MTTVVVVGNGMAGHRFVREALGLDPRRLAITVLGDEPGGVYNRVQLPNVLAGVSRADSIELAGEQWYADRGVRLRSPAAAAGIDRRARRVFLAGRGVLPYDVLVLATGSSAVLPAADGLVRGDGLLIPGAVTFRTIADCAVIGALAADARSAVILGAGVLGLETASGLAGRGLKVTLVQRGARLMDRQLDAAGSRVLARTVRSLGIRVRAGAAVTAVLGRDRVRGVVLDDGSTLDADLLVLCCGARPRIGLARAAGLAVGTGIVVDDQLRSVTDPAVFAIGDCAEHRGRSHGLVAPAWQQAAVAAQVIAGEPARYAGSLPVIRLKAAGIELASLGDTIGVPKGAEVIRFTDSFRSVYQKLVVREGRLAGAILLGDTRTAGTITQLLDRGAALPADRSSLLLARRAPPPTSLSQLPGQATICYCNGVTKAGICAAWQEGARHADQIAARTRATTGCGTCRDDVEGIVTWLATA